MNYSVIITDYKTIEITIEYIKKFITNCINEVKFVIIDNSTEMQGKEYLEKKDIKYTVLNMNSIPIYKFEIANHEVLLGEALRNGGYAKGNNLGAKISDYVFGKTNYIFSNNDIDFTKQIDLKLFDSIFKENENVGIIGPNIISLNGEKQNPRIEKSFFSQMILWYFNILWFRCRFTNQLWNRDIDGDTPKITNWVSGSFIIIRKRAFDLVNGFDENTFLYAEEMIISEKMRMMGYQTFYSPEMTVIHRHRGATSNYSQRKLNHISCLYYYSKYKNIGIINKMISNIAFYIAEGGYYILHKGNCLWKILKGML